uniref:Uncharacterized protein n=1 Tax=Trypanosoma congolense (strain IL3000) TaxID=1068625 RepID=G0USK7_TRYCI|nr:conserved hypothetical protein [Trypanosoma congolense IL3000]
MVAHTHSDFSEEIFSVLLESCTPSRTCIETLTHIALSNLPCATDTWAALRKALVKQEELASDENKALWYVLDSLMKHAPHVFVPLVAPRLYDYVVQQLPWNLVGVVSTYGSGALWCETMIGTWKDLLPPLLFRTLRSFVVHLRSGKELSRAMDSNDISEDVRVVDSPATREQLQNLQEAWEVFRSFAGECNVDVKGPGPVARAPTGAGGIGATEGLLPARVKQETGPVASGVVKSEYEAQVDASGGDEDDSDVEYIPNFVRGVQRRQLPPLTSENGVQQRQRRATRRRPREEEED